MTEKRLAITVYAFYHPEVTISYTNGRHAHDFICAAKSCKGKGRNARMVWRYLNTKDNKSTSSLNRHAKMCWGEEIVEQAAKAQNTELAWEALRNMKLKNRSITAIFERTGKGKITYSHRQHTKTETRLALMTSSTWCNATMTHMVHLSPSTNHHLPPPVYGMMMNHHPPPPIYPWPKRCIRNTSFGPTVCFFNLIFCFSLLSQAISAQRCNTMTSSTWCNATMTHMVHLSPSTNHHLPPPVHGMTMNHHPPPPIYLWPKWCIRNALFGPMVCFFNLIFLFFIAEPSHLSSMMQCNDQLDMMQCDNNPHSTPLTIHHCPPSPTSCPWPKPDHNTMTNTHPPPSTTSHLHMSMAQTTCQNHIIGPMVCFFLTVLIVFLCLILHYYLSAQWQNATMMYIYHHSPLPLHI